MTSRTLAAFSAGVAAGVVVHRLPRLLEASGLLLREVATAVGDVREDEGGSVGSFGLLEDALGHVDDAVERFGRQVDVLGEKLNDLERFGSGERVVSASSAKRVAKRGEASQERPESFAGGSGVSKVHGTSHSSVVGASEGSDAAGSVSADSAASCHCGETYSKSELVLIADRDGGMAHTPAECFGIAELSYERKWSL